MSSKENQIYISQENILPVKGLKVNNSLLTKNVQPKNNNAHLKNINVNGIQNKMNIQKTERNALKDIGGKNRQSLKPVKKELADGKIKKVTQKVNSAGKIKKTKKTSNVVKEDKLNKKDGNKVNNLSKPAKKESAETDFIIFCDENDELTIKAVEKENNLENVNDQERPNEEKKKKGLAERNSQPNQPKIIPKTTINPTLKAINSNIEILKNAVEPISNLTLEEFFLDEATLNESLVENKENDPTLMSIDISKVDDLELQQQQTIQKDVAGDMHCLEFSDEIYLYLLNRELKISPDPTYITKQPEINSKMRAMLVDWLIDVGIEFKLENETLFLAITYIDLFLSQLSISLQNFQLLGTAALLIASKYEEIYPPDIKEFIFVTDDAYTNLQMLTMEKLILKSLNFNISPPTINYFLQFFLTKLSLPLYVQYFAEYMCFLTLLQTEPFLSFSPSDIAISSIIMALHTYTLEDVVNLEEFKKLTKVHFHKDEEGNQSDAKAILIRQTCINEMYKLQKTAHLSSQRAVYTKYNSENYLRVASVEIADEVPLVENFFN